MRAMHGVRVTAAAVVTVAILAAAGCTSGSDEPAPSAGSAAVATTAASGPGGTAVEPTPDTTLVAPPPASVLPPPVTVDGAPVLATTCRSLGDTLAVSDLLPRDLGSWPDERQRVVVDARRDAALYEQAAASAPTVMVAPIGALRDYATWIAENIQDAPDFPAAQAALDQYPSAGEVAAAAGEVDRWKRANCL